MIVQRSDVAMASMHSRVSGREARLEIRSRGEPPREPPPANPSDSLRAEGPPRRRSWTDSVLQRKEPVAGSSESDDSGLSPQDAQKVRLIEALIEALTGRKVKLRIWNGRCAERPGNPSLPESGEGAARPTDPGDGSDGGGLRIAYTERRWEEESLSYSAKGSVRTSDGRTLEFSLSMGMRRSQSTETSLVLSTGTAARRKDPLVVNFDGAVPKLGERPTGFDLDADGVTDSVHFATGGSAFLARDAGHGLVDGSNLFGPETGDGFAELARFDADGNGWIDAGDPVWADLRLWNRDEAGQDWVWMLDEKGIGAISLANSSTPFTLENAAGNETGRLGATGVWIGESGAAGTVNHVDLVA